MAVEVPMPVLTEEGEDGVVTAWFVDEGSPVSTGQLLAEVQVEKVAEEVHAPADGVVVGLVGINEPVPQGAPICRIEEAATVAAAPAAAATAAAPPEPAARVAASPAAKRVARELGVDLGTVAGTGPDGRITESDVRAAAGAAPAGLALSGLRAVIARNMRESHAVAAAVTLTTTVDLTAAGAEKVTARVVKAAATALADHPALHGSRDGDDYLPAETAHIAVAIQTDEGLVAPVVREPAAKSVDSIADEVAGLAERARVKRLEAADYAGGTFSVTNLGPWGVDGFTPIINPPQLAILGVGALRTVPGFSEDGSVVPRRQMVLSLTFDHAFVDGAPAAAFLARVRELLESPGE